MTNKENRKEFDYATIGISQLLTPTNVAGILGISVKTVNKLVRDGKLGCVQVTSKERRFTDEQVRVYIDAQSKGIQDGRVDRKHAPRVSLGPKKGGQKSSSFFDRANLLKEIRSWQ